MKKEKFLKWVKSHKKELILAGVCVGALIATVILFQNKNAIKSLWKKLSAIIATAGPAICTVNEEPICVEEIYETPSEEMVRAAREIVETVHEEDVIAEVISRSAPDHPVNVSECIVNLPVGKHPSAEKIMTAAEFGFELGEGQTWRKPYIKYKDAA